MKKLKYYFLGIILCLYGINQYSDVCICVLLTIFLLINIKNDSFEYLYFGLIFFEPILDLPFIGGSFFRIYQLLFVIKVIYEATTRNISFALKNICMISAIFLIFSGILYQGTSEEISLIINITIMVYIICKKRENNKFYEELLYVLGVIITFSSIYGFFRGNVISYGSFIRKSTTVSDPNYSALFINIGIFSILNNKIVENKERIILLVILFMSLLLTVSLTGICGCLIFFIIYCMLCNLKKGMKNAIILLCILITFINLPIEQGNILYGIQSRILKIGKSSTNDISSGRIELAYEYLKEFNNMGLKEILIGGNNTISGDFRDSMVQRFSNVSHNSYVDILYMTGIIGFSILIYTYLFGIYGLFKEYKRGDSVAINYIMLKVILLYFAMTISIFPYRYFMAIYLLNIPVKGDSKKR